MRSDDVYVVGAGMHPFGRHEGVSGLDMAEHALRAALVDDERIVLVEGTWAMFAFWRAGFATENVSEKSPE